MYHWSFAVPIPDSWQLFQFRHSLRSIPLIGIHFGQLTYVMYMYCIKISLYSSSWSLVTAHRGCDLREEWLAIINLDNVAFSLSEIITWKIPGRVTQVHGTTNRHLEHQKTAAWCSRLLEESETGFEMGRCLPNDQRGAIQIPVSAEKSKGGIRTFVLLQYNTLVLLCLF
jgi:hypothetical protein